MGTGFEASARFRNEFAAMIEEHPDLSEFRVTDGHVPVGTKWAAEIRERISRAKVIVADVTGFRSEVVFELGLAFGLRRAVIPVTEGRVEAETLPRWLGGTQIGTYSNEAGLLGVVTSVAAHLAEPDLAKWSQPSEPVPGQAVWLGKSEWATSVVDAFVTAAKGDGLLVDVLDEMMDEEVAVAQGTKASLLVLPCDGGHLDSLRHFVAGSVVAKPRAGQANPKLERRILVVAKPGAALSEIVAEGLRRCSEVVEVVSPESVRSKTKSYGLRYRKWAHSKGTGS
jgi:hypothetical protein